jgi:chromosome segregation ATPase
MDKTKVVPIILLIIILGVGFVAYNFYAQSTQLKANNQELRNINSSLQREKNSLQQKHQREVQKNRELNQRISSINQQLSQIEQERNELNDKYQKATQERDQLAEKLRERPQGIRVEKASVGSDKSDDYWVDFIQEKAELEAQVDKLKQQVLDAKSQVAQFRNENEELSLETNEIKKKKENLEQEINTKKRALRVVSMDLVAERRQRGEAVNEVKKLRDETSSLKRQLIMANRQKGKLQDKLRETLDKKNTLEEKIIDAESILQEKSLAFKELQTDLSQTMEEGRRVTAGDSGSVELPPIIVKPETSTLMNLKGEVIAVNPEEQFVVFDLGESSGISPGALLKVMRGNREVATLEVIETRKNISAADIKDVVGNFDIQEGDIVISR